MKPNWILTTVLATGFLASFFFFQSCSKKAAQCPLCERDVHQGMQVSIADNKIQMQTCCMACALTYQAQTRNVEIKTATDFPTDTRINPKTAFYVVGSDVSPCTQNPKVEKFVREPHAALHACYDRCEPGILGFRGKKDAQKYQEQNGGSIYEFEQLRALISVQGRSPHD